MADMICTRAQTCGHTRKDNPGSYCCAGEPHEHTEACKARTCPHDGAPCDCLEVNDGEED